MAPRYRAIVSRPPHVIIIIVITIIITIIPISNDRM